MSRQEGTVLQGGEIVNPKGSILAQVDIATSSLSSIGEMQSSAWQNVFKFSPTKGANCENLILASGDQAELLRDLKMFGD